MPTLAQSRGKESHFPVYKWLLSADNGNLDTIETLLEAGARLNCGKSCLLEPARNMRDDILKSSSELEHYIAVWCACSLGT